MKKIVLSVCVVLILAIGIQRVITHLYLPQANSSKVVIYTTDWCVYCEALRKTLTEYEVNFTDYNTELSLHGMIGYLMIGGQGVPVSVIGNQVLYGYDGQEVTDALVQAGHEIPAVW